MPDGSAKLRHLSFPAIQTAIRLAFLKAFAAIDQNFEFAPLITRNTLRGKGDRHE
jgi:hypothetical protein